MPITFYCTACTQKLRIDDDFAGKRVACTRCGEKLRVPLERDAVIAVAPANPPAEAAVRPAAKGREQEQAAASESPVPSVAPSAAHAPLPRVRQKLKKSPEEPLVKAAMKIDFEELIDMTAMVDIVFFLLIFFLVTSMNAIDSSVPLPAPDPQKTGASDSRSVAELESDSEFIIVRIDRNDAIFVNDIEVRNEKDLLFKLRDLRTSGSRPDKMLVVGHGDANHGTAVMVLDTGREVGIEQVRLSVADDSE